MATIKVKVPIDIDWSPNDRLRMRLGSEGASDLASSTPSGGTVVVDERVWPDGLAAGGFGADPLGDHPFGDTSIGVGFGDGEFGLGALGVNDGIRRELEHRYDPTDKCAQLPVGVEAVDAPGNVSAVVESCAQIKDTPVGARGLTLATTGTPLEARLSWTSSPDV